MRWYLPQPFHAAVFHFYIGVNAFGYRLVDDVLLLFL